MILKNHIKGIKIDISTSYSNSKHEAICAICSKHIIRGVEFKIDVLASDWNIGVVEGLHEQPDEDGEKRAVNKNRNYSSGDSFVWFLAVVSSELYDAEHIASFDQFFQHDLLFIRWLNIIEGKAFR